MGHLIKQKMQKFFIAIQSALFGIVLVSWSLIVLESHIVYGLAKPNYVG
jgi:hypothetical protein